MAATATIDTAPDPAGESPLQHPLESSLSTGRSWRNRLASAWMIASLIGAALFARRPDELRLGSLRAMSWATAFVSFAGFVAGIAVTLAACANLPPDVARAAPEAQAFPSSEAQVDPMAK